MNNTHQPQKLYKVWQISLAGFFGTAAGFYLLSRNFKVLGKEKEAKFFLVFAFVLAGLIILYVLSPWTSDGVTLAITLGGYIGVTIAAKSSRTDIENYERAGGSVHSVWRALGIMLVWDIAIVGMILVITFIYISLLTNAMSGIPANY